MEDIFNTTAKYGYDCGGELDASIVPWFKSNKDLATWDEVMSDGYNKMFTRLMNDGYKIYTRYTNSGVYEITKIEKGPEQNAQVPFILLHCFCSTIVTSRSRSIYCYSTI